MQPRIFGKELTNLLQPDTRNRKSYSYMHPPKPIEQLNPLQKAQLRTKNNQSLDTKQQKNSTIPLPLNNPQMVPEYLLQNLAFLKAKELEHHRSNNYIVDHKTISQQERSKLVDWVAKLHYKYKMFPQTLFTIVSLIDQYLAIKDTPVSDLQLVGVASVFIAAKFEQTYQVPPLKQLISTCAYQYTHSQILQKEADIIKQLNFNLIINNTYKFFEPYSKIIGLELKNQHLAHYLLQLALLQPKFLLYPPSLLAASSIYLIKKIRRGESPWTENMSIFVGYDQKQLKICAKQLCSLLEIAPQLENSSSIKQKFSQPSFHEVTRIKLERKDKK